MKRWLALLVTSAVCISCAGMKEMMKDPRDTQPLRAWRVGGTSPGAACGEACNTRYENCMPDTSDADQAATCADVAIECYEACPAVSVHDGAQGTVLTEQNGLATCQANMKEPTHCFVYNTADPYKPGRTYSP